MPNRRQNLANKKQHEGLAYKTNSDRQLPIGANRSGLFGVFAEIMTCDEFGPVVDYCSSP